jgi:hypothetical protein
MERVCELHAADMRCLRRPTSEQPTPSVPSFKHLPSWKGRVPPEILGYRIENATKNVGVKKAQTP